MSEIYRATSYRGDLAKEIRLLRSSNGKAARKFLEKAKETSGYRIAETLYRNPDALIPLSPDNTKVLKSEDGESAVYGYYQSNEVYFGLAPRLNDLGGVGLAVGSDQGLDFYTMANLDEVYNIDIDPYTHIVTRAYLEIGTRFHSLLGRYPKTREYIAMFNDDQWKATCEMLRAPSSNYIFPTTDLYWLERTFADHEKDSTLSYLRKKNRFFGKNTWIGTDETLEHTIKGYEEGKIHVFKGDITGKIIPFISERIKEQGQKVSLIYTSNAPVGHKHAPEVFKRLLPVDDSTKIVFSSKNCNFELVDIPKFLHNFAMHWSIFTFSCGDFDKWPNLDHVEGKIIDKGYYELTNITL
jgi:hypothetical protein